MKHFVARYIIPIFIFGILGFWILSQVEKAGFPSPDIEHSIIAQNKPWTHLNFDARDDKFTFAIVSDLWGGYRAGIFDVAIGQLNLLRPEFVMSVGDLIDGGTEDRDQLQLEWDAFDAMINRVQAPVFRVGGNHDLTNPVMRKFWENRFGARYYHFTYKNALFLVIDSEDFEPSHMQEVYEMRADYIRRADAGEDMSAHPYTQIQESQIGEISAEQSAYFERVLAENNDVTWTFLFMHKPTWMHEDGKGLERIEEALLARRYSVFNGHFHRFSHRQRLGQDYTILATTGGSQTLSDPNSFDQITLVTMDDTGPSVAHLRMDGILDKTGKIPANGDGMCFHRLRCSDNQ